MCNQCTYNEEAITDNQQITIINEGSNELAIDAYLLDVIDRDELRRILAKAYQVMLFDKPLVGKPTPNKAEEPTRCFCGQIHGIDYHA